MRDHTRLRAFELADDVAMLVYRVIAVFPKEELFGLTSQIRRAAVSVPSNIVDGCARDSEADYLRFLNIAFRLNTRAVTISQQAGGFLVRHYQPQHKEGPR
jgi:hypothetical protein